MRSGCDAGRSVSSGETGGSRSETLRVFVIGSRQILIDSKFSTVICAPMYSSHHGLSTQVLVGPDEGLRHESSIHCDELVSLPKAALSHFVGRLSRAKLVQLDRALVAALDIDTGSLSESNEQ